MSAPPPPRRTGTPIHGLRVGGLELVDRLGVGGVAEVFRAIRRRPGQPPQLVAVKRMRKDAVDNPFFNERFMAEADVVQMLRHPNVVGGHEVGSSDGAPWVVMDYVDGKTLDRVVNAFHSRRRLLDTSTAVYVIRELLKGLTYVHELKSPGGRPLRIVHRDVTPDNVLLSYTGDVALTDFGIALLDGIESSAEDGPVAGKLGYLSPEQAARGALDARSDIFAVGCILYELTVGRGPFAPVGNETEEQVLARVLDARFTRPSKVIPSYPKDLEKVVMTAMEKKPRNRFSDGNAFIRALDDLSFVRADEKELLGNMLRAAFASDYAAMRLEVPPV